MPTPDQRPCKHVQTPHKPDPNQVEVNLFRPQGLPHVRAPHHSHRMRSRSRCQRHFCALEAEHKADLGLQ